jgi:uncharacterized hydrophobic protein (TIGR00341 family)
LKAISCLDIQYGDGMALRFVEIFLPQEKESQLFTVLEDFPAAQIIQKEYEGGQLHTKLLMKAENTEKLLDRLEAKFTFSEKEQFRIVIVPVAATIPRMDEPEEKPEEVENKKEKKFQWARVSREELYHNIQESSELTPLFVVMVVLSAIVAAIGLMRGNTAVVIGAMVIAPLLGPNVALALAATLGDLELARKARKANLAGILLPLLLAALAGAVFTNTLSSAEIQSRTLVNESDIILALAAGCVATLSFTMALSNALIGVMVAVALLPPLVTCGILIGAGQWKLATGAGLLYLTNLICVNLAGVVTFLIQGVRPLWYWEQDKARKHARRALIVWLILLALLAAFIRASRLWLN